MTDPIRPRCFLDIQHGTDPIGRVVIELFTDKTPKTCENFRALCTASKSPELHYKSTIFHRVIEEFMLQGGDITRGDGKGGKSIYGETFEDENLGWCDIDKEGLVCMANRGKDTNSSQFFITCAPCDHLNGKHTVFGHVVAGLQFVKQIETVKVNAEDKPIVDVIISNCGELEFRRAAPIKPAKTVTDTKLRDRKRPRSRSPYRSRSRSRDRDPSVDSRHGGSKDTDQDKDKVRSRSKSRTKSRSRSRSPRGKTDRHKQRRDTRPNKRNHRSRSPPRNEHSTKEPASPQNTRPKSRSKSPGKPTPLPGQQDSRPPRRRRSRRSYSRSRSRSRSRDIYRSRRNYDDYDSEEERRVQREEEEREGARWQQQYQRPYRSPPRRTGDRYLDDDAYTSSGQQEVKFKGRGSMKYREKGGGGGGYNRYGRLI